MFLFSHLILSEICALFKSLEHPANKYIFSSMNRIWKTIVLKLIVLISIVE